MKSGSSEELRLEVRNLRKSFGNIKAVKNASLHVKAGETIGLIGENGAGKSTLIGILGGKIQPDSGEVLLNGELRGRTTPRQAREDGIAIVYQELMLCPNFSAIENIFLGRTPGKFGVGLDRREMQKVGNRILDDLGFHESKNAPVESLPLADQQLVEIARAVAEDTQVLVLDEPTASLSPDDFDRLARIVRRIASHGTAVIFVSHRLDEIFELCSRVTVMRDGETVADVDAKSVDAEDLAGLMSGEKKKRVRAAVVGESKPSGERPPAAPVRHTEESPVLEVRNASCPHGFSDVSLTVSPGEIVGLAGVRGSGRRELLDCIYGLRKLSAGSIFIEGEEQHHMTPATMRARGVGYLPEDRKTEAIVEPWDVRHNLALGNTKLVAPRGPLTRKRLTKWASEIIEATDIRPKDPEHMAIQLSGGNQQRVALARVLASDPRVLLLLEPTRGIDIRAKEEIRELVLDTARSQNKGVLLVESDIVELLAMSDRILVFHRGEIMGELAGDSMTQSEVALLSHGHA